MKKVISVMLVVLAIGFVGCEKEELDELETSNLTLNSQQKSADFAISFYKSGIYEINDPSFIESDEIHEKLELGATNVAQLLKESSGEYDVLTLSIAKNGDLVSSIESLIPSISAKGYRNGNIDSSRFVNWNQDEFEACVGHWWCLPGVSLITCAIGCAIACN